MKFLARAGFAAGLMLALSGCYSMSNDTPVVAAAVTNPVIPAAPAAPVAPPSYSGLVDGALGASLNANDKTAANKAEVAALVSGERKTWRGDDGSYGYIAPAAGAGGDCRDFVHTVYINGRPKVGKGAACRQGDSWKLS